MLIANIWYLLHELTKLITVIDGDAKIVDMQLWEDLWLEVLKLKQETTAMAIIEAKAKRMI